MKRTRFSDTRIVTILRQADVGLKVKDLCREHGISEATYYNKVESHVRGAGRFGSQMAERGPERAVQADTDSFRSRLRESGLEGSTRLLTWSQGALR